MKDLQRALLKDEDDLHVHNASTYGVLHPAESRAIIGEEHVSDEAALRISSRHQASRTPRRMSPRQSPEFGRADEASSTTGHERDKLKLDLPTLYSSPETMHEESSSSSDDDGVVFMPPAKRAQLNRVLTRLATADLSTMDDADNDERDLEMQSVNASIPNEKAALIIDDIRELREFIEHRKRNSSAMREEFAARSFGIPEDEVLFDDNAWKDSEPQDPRSRSESGFNLRVPIQRGDSLRRLSDASSCSSVDLPVPNEYSNRLMKATSTDWRSRSGSSRRRSSDSTQPAVADELSSRLSMQTRATIRGSTVRRKPCFDNDATSNPTLQASLWKKRVNISKAAKLQQVFFEDVCQIFRGEKIQSARYKDYFKELQGLAKETLFKQKERSKSLDAKDNPGQGWDYREVCLFGSKLSWSKHSQEEMTQTPRQTPRSKSSRAHVQTGELYGSSVEATGSVFTDEGELFTFQVYPPPRVCAHPLIFAADDEDEREEWVKALRAAAEYPLPLPRPRRGCCSLLCDFIKQRPPPAGQEQPKPILEIEVVGASSLRVKWDCARGVYILGTVHHRSFRTVTKHEPHDLLFQNRFSIPVEQDGADDLLHFEVFEEAQFADQEGRLLGGITVPLFKLGRNQLVELVLPIRQPKNMKLVNSSVGNMVIQARFCQPLGHLWLPVESQPQQDNVDFGDLEMQIARIDALVQLLVYLIDSIAGILQWEDCCYSFLWFLSLEIWALRAWPYSLSIIVAFVLQRTLRQWYRVDAGTRPGDMQVNNEMLVSNEILRASMSSSMRCSSSSGSRSSKPVLMKRLSLINLDQSFDLESGVAMASIQEQEDRLGELPRKFSHQRTTTSLQSEQSSSWSPSQTSDMTGYSVDDSIRRTIHGDTSAKHDATLWEAERRIILLGFDKEYLHDFDPPAWSDENGEQLGTAWSAPPVWLVGSDGERHRYTWKVVLDEWTDEEGWTYATSFDSEQWTRSLDPTWSWVRRRRRHGVRRNKLERGQTDELREKTQHAIALGLADPVPQQADTDTRGAVLQGMASASKRVKAAMMLNEKNLFSRYLTLYEKIHHDLVEILVVIEKHKNLFTWKHETVSKVVCAGLAILLILTLLVSTSVIFFLIVLVVFWVGYVVGSDKRHKRKVFMEQFNEWCNKQFKGTSKLKVSDKLTTLDDTGCTPTAIRNFCFKEYDVALDLRTVCDCKCFGDLADKVVQGSPKVKTVVQRYRAWHSDFYQNFLDHVPTDIAERDITSGLYVPPAATSLISVP